MSDLKESNRVIRQINQTIECPSCGLVQHYPEIQHGELIACSRCGRELSRHPVSKNIAVPFAFAVSSAILYVMILVFPLLSINVYGRTNELGVFSGVIEYIRQGFSEVGLLVGAVIIFFPIIVIVIMLIILITSLRKDVPRYFPYLLHIYKMLRPWSMTEVYILGVFVAYTKLVGMAYVHIDYALYALIFLMISMSITDASVDFMSLWKRCPISPKTSDKHGVIEVSEYTSEQLPENDRIVSCECCNLVFAVDHVVAQDDHIATCPRCYNPLHRRKPNSINRTLALLIAAFIFYIPANLYPIMSMTMMGKESSHKIFGGVVELWQNDLIPLALLVFVASIAVPVLKIVGIAYMLCASLLGSKQYLIGRSKAFQVISFIGRWSMIDVFMISILIALIKFDSFSSVYADPGIVMFSAVVVLTIFAADFFDSRLMWDYADMNKNKNEDNAVLNQHTSDNIK